MTNQNDTQDETEKLAEEAYPDTRIMGEMVDRSHERMVYVDGYRAGLSSVADKHLELATKYSDLAEKYCASRAEVERLKQELIHETKGTAYCICGERGIEREFDYICEPCGRSWMSAKQIASYDLKLLVDLREQLAAEKQKALKLVEALKYYRGIVKGTWGYDGIIAAKYDNAISDYSTASGDGSGKMETNK